MPNARYESTNVYVADPGRALSSGAEEAQLSRALGAFSHETDAIAAPRARTEAKLEGEAAGRTETPAFRTGFGDLAQAFNDAAKVTYGMQVHNDLASKTQQFLAEHPADAEAFASQFDPYAEALLAKVHPEARSLVQGEIATRRTEAEGAISQNYWKQEQERRADILKSYLGVTTDEMIRAAVEGNGEGVAYAKAKWDAALQKEVDEGRLAPEQMMYAQLERNRAVYVETERRNFDVAPNKAAFIAHWDPPDYVSQKQINAVKSYFHARLAEERQAATKAVAAQAAKAKMRRAEDEREVKGLVARLDAGLPVGPREVGELVLRVSRPTGAIPGSEDLALRLQEAQAFAGEKAALASMGPEERAAHLDEAAPLVRTEDEVKYFTAAQQLHAEWTKAQFDDPVAYHNAHALPGEELPPIDPFDPKQVTDRVERARGVADRWGLPAIPPLSKREEAQLITRFDALDVVSKVDALDRLSSAIQDPATKQALATKLADKHLPMSAALFLTGEGQHDVAASVLRGAAVTGSATFDFEDGGAVGFDSIFREVAGDVYAGTPENETLALQAAHSHYRAMAQSAGLRVANLDLAKRAVKDVVGNVVKHNGKQTVAPVRGMDQADFEHWIQTIDGSYLEQLGGVDGDVDRAADLIRENGQLFDPRPDGYQVWVTSDDGVRRTLMAPDGKPFRLSYQPLLARRPAKNTFQPPAAAYGAGLPVGVQ